jgi:hypothetical protein
MLHTLNRPARQSGQGEIRRIYGAVKMLGTMDIRVTAVWNQGDQWTAKARKRPKEKLRREPEPNQDPNLTVATKATVARSALMGIRRARPPSTATGAFTRTIDAALSGKHTRRLYQRKKEEAKVLAQSRTGANRLNSYLHRIGAAETDECACGATTETVKHFLFLCRTWMAERKRLLYDRWSDRMRDTSFFLGGRARTEDPEGWTPDWDAVNATTAYV